MEDKELVFDREHHILYTKQCREEILNKISLHYSAEDVEKIFTKVQFQYIEFLKRLQNGFRRKKEFPQRHRRKLRLYCSVQLLCGVQRKNISCGNRGDGRQSVFACI